MKKFIFFAMLALLLSVSTAQAAEKSYVNGIDANYPPFGYMDEKGQPAGFDVESMNWIAKKMGFKIEHKPIAWDGIIPALLAKQIDMIASGMSITPDRQKQVNFSTPYWNVARVFITKKDSSFTPADFASKKVKVGAQRGTNESKEFKKEVEAKKYDVEVILYESSPLIVEDILNGRIQAGLMDSAPANDAINKGKAVKTVGTFGETSNFGIAMRKGDEELAKLVEEGYKLLKADPYWEELQKKYKPK